jgi:ATP-dependent DNA ligase
MRRFGRKLDVERMRAELPLSSYFFDCLYLDGRDLTGLGQSERAEAMRERLMPGAIVPRIVTADPEEAETFLADALARGHEGVMAKALDSAYEAGRRGGAWLKIKLAQTLDLVVLAAEWGHGRRSGYLSNLHLGARDPEKRRLRHARQDVQGHDRRDARLADEQAREIAIASDDWTVHVRPELVVEIAYNDLTGEPALSGRPGAALRAREALPPGQACRGCRHDRRRARRSRAQHGPGASSSRARPRLFRAPSDREASSGAGRSRPSAARCLSSSCPHPVIAISSRSLPALSVRRRLQTS